MALMDGRTVAEDRPGPDQKEDDSDDKYVDPKAKPRIPFSPSMKRATVRYWHGSGPGAFSMLGAD